MPKARMRRWLDKARAASVDHSPWLSSSRISLPVDNCRTVELAEHEACPYSILPGWAADACEELFALFGGDLIVGHGRPSR